MVMEYAPQYCFHLICFLCLGFPTDDSDMDFLKQTEVSQLVQVVEVKVGILKGPHVDAELNRFKVGHSTWMIRQPIIQLQVAQFGESTRTNDMTAGLVAAQPMTEKLQLFDFLQLDQTPAKLPSIFHQTFLCN